MDLKGVQLEVDDWIGQFKEGYWPPLANLARLAEELGELAREVNHAHGHKPKKQDEPPGEIALEIGDMLFVLVCLANSLGLDLEEVFQRTMAKYRQRDGKRWTPQ